MKKTLFKALIGLLALLAIAAGTVAGCRLAVLGAPVRMYYQAQLAGLDETYDYIVVPGSAIKGTEPGLRLGHRLETAAKLYHQGVSECIVVSGAHDGVHILHESLVMRDDLIRRGVPEEAILVDMWGVDTAETIRRTRDLPGEGRVIVCTQSMYAPRTSYLAQSFGLDADIADSDICIYTDGVGAAWLRETLAAVKAVFEGWFVPTGARPLQMYPMRGGDGHA